MKSRFALLTIVAVAMAVAAATTQGRIAVAGALDGVAPPAPPAVVVGGTTTMVVSFHDDAGSSVMTATVGAPNNFVFTAATVAPACAAATAGLATGTVTLNDVACDANNLPDAFTWTLTLTCTAANPIATPSTPITVIGQPSASNSGSITVSASCTGTTTPPPTQVFECFSTQRGPDAAATVRLITQNFGGDLVRVRNLVMMCELGFKVKPVPGTNDPPSPTPDPAQTRIFACYKLERGSDPNDPFTLTTDNFGADRLVVRDSNLVCEEGTKTRVKQPTAGGPPTTEITGNMTGVVWQCYRLAQGKEANAPFRLVTSNFGRHDVRIGRAFEMCEEAAKERVSTAGAVTTSGAATGKVLECFAIRADVNPNAPVTLETRNFGKANTVIQRPVMMCEPGKKTPVYTFTGPENPRPEEADPAGD